MLQRAAPSQSGAFSGAARTLGGGGDGGAAADAQPAQEPEPAAPEPVVHTITFFDNGVFTVDDGAAVLFFSSASHAHYSRIQQRLRMRRCVSASVLPAYSANFRMCCTHAHHVTARVANVSARHRRLVDVCQDPISTLVCALQVSHAGWTIPPMHRSWSPSAAASALESWNPPPAMCQSP